MTSIPLSISLMKNLKPTPNKDFESLKSTDFMDGLIFLKLNAK